MILKSKYTVIVVLLACLLLNFDAHAGGFTCDKGQIYSSIFTPAGILISRYCTKPDGSRGEFWFLNDKLLYGAFLAGPEGDNLKTVEKKPFASLIVLNGPNDFQLGCQGSLILLDLTRPTPHVFQFGVHNGCAEYHWSSWGKKRSVIAIKDNVKFTYSDGKLLPPPPDFGGGIPIGSESATDDRMWGYVKELPVPYLQPGD